MSRGTVSNVLNRPDSVAEPTLVKVETAMAKRGYVRNGISGARASRAVRLTALLVQGGPPFIMVVV